MGLSLITSAAGIGASSAASAKARKQQKKADRELQRLATTPPDRTNKHVAGFKNLGISENRGLGTTRTSPGHSSNVNVGVPTILTGPR